MPRLDEGAIAMQIWRLPSISLEQSNEISTVAELVLLEEFSEEVETVVSRTGRAEIATDPMGVEISDTYIILKPKDDWRFKSKEELFEALLVRELTCFNVAWIAQHIGTVTRAHQLLRVSRHLAL